MVKLNNEETKKILFFQQITGASARDCIIDDGSIVFLVSEGEVGKAVGKKGINIKMLENLLKKKVYVIEHSNDLNKFIKNIFFPTNIINITLNKTNDTITIKTDGKNKKYIIGKDGKKINLAKLILKRHFNINNIKVF